MPQNILIATVSPGGSTAGVAEAIAEVLRKYGATVDVRPVQDVQDVASYDAVVVGSAVQASAWMPEALDFVKQNQANLLQKPFAAFLVCLTLAMKNVSNQHQQMVQSWLEPVRSLVPTVCEGFFAGVLDFSKIPYFGARIGFRIATLFGIWKVGDHRDWDAINTWAHELAKELKLTEATAEMV